MQDTVGRVESWWGQCLAQDPHHPLGQAEPVRLVWEQVERCRGSCCHAGLPSAPKGLCTRAGLGSTGLRPGGCGKPQGFSPAGLLDTSPPAPAVLRARRWLGACTRPAGTFLRFPGQWRGPGLLSGSHTQHLLRASPSSRALSACSVSAAVCLSPLARWGRHVQCGTARRRLAGGSGRSPSPRLSLAGAGSWQQDGWGTGAGEAGQDCARLLLKTCSGQGTCLDTLSLSQAIPGPLPLPCVLAGNAQAVCTSAFCPPHGMHVVPADSLKAPVLTSSHCAAAGTSCPVCQ